MGTRTAPGEPLELETPHGPARVHLHPVARPIGALVLGHGAGGSVTAPDLAAATRAATAAGVSVALVEQPYRVAGRRSAAPARQLDAAWVAILSQVRAGPLAELDVVVGGRSSGARVACRTAAQTSAAGVLCLAFPLLPPARRDPNAAPPVSRQPELDAVPAGVPVLVLQGERDRFGLPERSEARAVLVLAGDHRLAADLDAVTAAVAAWLPGVLTR